ncbi:MAG: V-type ATP synthase subunit D [Oscillospiraceae bacterium]|nr:V-type ATP synthase subunit D [Oscillospiraceae bacterium]MDD4368955.1 V-type ATP synthase subunit D [Oscillospiraceae bacterium]
MASFVVSPTRMELSRIKAELQLAQRGYKLLKDKQDELMRQFIGTIRTARQLRQTCDQRYRDIRTQAVLAAALFTRAQVQADCLSAQNRLDLVLQLGNQMGVLAPEWSLANANWRDKEYLSLSPDLAQTRQEMLALLPDLLRLAQLEKRCVILSGELEKTRRRVNALEYLTIPQFEETLRFIRSRLDDAERDRVTRLLKMQDFAAAAAKQAALDSPQGTPEQH